jgi:phage terminase large subunit-like protein
MDLLEQPRLHQLWTDFALLSHIHQVPPLAANDGGAWTVWLMLAGRGAGKTRTGAEWVRGLVHGHPPFAHAPHGAIALVGETEHDVREVMIDGPAGLLHNGPRAERPNWTPTRRRLEWANGAVGYAFSAEDPEQLRGPQFEAAWCDELAKWRYVQDTFDMLQFGLRLGAHPRQLITTTPRPIPLIRKLVDDPRTAVTRASTHANAAFLSPAFLDAVLGRYQGTRLGRQEIGGEIVEERQDALWKRAEIEACRLREAPPLKRIVVGVDPPASHKPGADACGIVAAGRDEQGIVYVLEDATIERAAPAQWAARAVALYQKLEADLIVAEANMGGDMVEAVLRQVDRGVPVRMVRAARGKQVRAEPVSALYEQGRVKHVGARLGALEDEMCDFAEGGLSDGRSPDRVDALVWAVTELTKSRAEPRIRSLGWDGSERPSHPPFAPSFLGLAQRWRPGGK